jgi:hypothetical protein
MLDIGFRDRDVRKGGSTRYGQWIERIEGIDLKKKKYKRVYVLRRYC